MRQEREMKKPATKNKDKRITRQKDKVKMKAGTG